MATVTKTVLKSHFQQGDIPTQGNYVDLIDSQFGLGEEGTQIIQGTISASAAEVEFISFKKIYLPGNGVGSMKVGTTFTIGSTIESTGNLNISPFYSSSGLLLESGSVSASGDLYGTNLIISNNITSSNNISASSAVYANAFYANSGYRIKDSGGTSRHIITENTNTLSIGNTNFYGIAITGSITSSGDIRTSGNISGSKTSFSIANFTSNITSSYARITNEITTGGRIDAEMGINIMGAPVSISTAWSNTGTITQERPTIKLTLTNLPGFNLDKDIYSNEYMKISNANISSTSIIIINQQLTTGAAAGTLLQPMHIDDGEYKIVPYNVTTGNGPIAAGGTATYNITFF